jgi:hypothetical protein
MSTANEYRQYAEECVRSAHDADTPEVTEKLLAMAQTWRTAAVQFESSGHVPTPRDRSDLMRIVSPHPNRATRW